MSTRPMLAMLLLCACVPKAEPDSEGASANSSATVDYDLETVEPVVQHRMTAGNTQKPVLLYLFVNQSEEPMMQLFVDLELRDLRRNCKEEGGIRDWIAVVNSHLVHMAEGHALLCKDGKFSIVKFQSDAAKKFRTEMASGPTVRRYDHKPEFDAAYAQVPLGERWIFESVLGSMASVGGWNIGAYAYFIHLKSHGGNSFISTGLTEEYLKAKFEAEAPKLRALGLMADGQTMLMPAGTEGLYPEELAAVGLGDKEAELIEARKKLNDERVSLAADGGVLLEPEKGGTPLEPDGQGTPLDPEHEGTPLDAGRQNDPLGAAAALGAGTVSLGAGVGLGVDNYYGLTPDQFIQSIGKFLQPEPGYFMAEERPPDFFIDVAFVMIESCSTNYVFDETQIGRRDIRSYFKDVMAYYSAKGGLWFSNLHWSAMAKEAGPSAFKLQELVIKKSAAIKNMIPKRTTEGGS